jgi:hypothetical protein
MFVGSAVMGFVGLALIALGALQPKSPFTSAVPGSWPFHFSVSSVGQGGGTLLVYSGIVVLLAAWYLMGISSAERPLHHLYVVLAAWCVPLFAMPPLFSRDVYAYAALGQLTSRGSNPYTYSPASLRAPSYLRFVDPLWRHAHAPYGPLFMDLGRGISTLAGQSVVTTIESYRLVSLVGLLLIAVSVPVLARSTGRQPSAAFILAVLNPMVLLYLVGGAHNDALMLGLLVAGVAVSIQGLPAFGIVVCALAAEVKIPGLIGVVFIGWTWGGQGSSYARRCKYLVGAILIAGVTMAVISELSGLGWGWLSSLSDPGTVISWLDPATALGLATSHVLGAVGVAHHVHPVIVATRAVGLVAAGLFTVIMMIRSDRYGLPKALGLSLLAIVILGPIVWPWYEAWGIVFLAFVVDRWARRLVLVVSAVACFATAPTHLLLSTAAWFGLGSILLGVVAVTLAFVQVNRKNGRSGSQSGALLPHRMAR